MRRSFSSPHQSQPSQYSALMPDIFLVSGSHASMSASPSPVNMITREMGEEGGARGRRGNQSGRLSMMEREKIVSRNMNGTSKYPP